MVDAGDGYSMLVNENSGLVLGIKDASTAAGAVALQSRDDGTDGDLWRLVPVESSVPSTASARQGRIR